MAASQFIALLESRGLLDPEIIAELHRQVEQTKGRITPEAIAKLLVENGQLTRFQATKLVTELNESLGDSRPDPSMALRGGRPLEPAPSEHDSVEDLLPDDFDDVVEVVEVVENGIDEVEIVDIAEPKSTPSAKRPAGFGPDAPIADQPKRVVRDTKVKSRSAWESFRIIGYAFILLLLLILLVPLVGWLMKGSADEAFTRAEDAYKARDYEKATKSFSDFAANYANDARTSKSKVFAGLAKIRQDAEKAADPNVALQTCQDVLPGIANESGLNELRGDVTDTLLRISEKFVAKIENTDSIGGRKELITKMDQQLELIRDPRYVGTQERTQNELRIRKIEEDQNRLLREITRGEDLASTLAAMKTSVEAKDVSKTYDLRRTLVRKYPQLSADSKLGELLSEATKIQLGLVTASSAMPIVNSEVATKLAGNKAILAGRTISGTDGESGSTIYLRVAGSVVAMNAGNGRVLWRHHIGRDWTGSPKRVNSTDDSDVLVYVQEQGLLKRLAAADGSVLWETTIPGRIVEPLIDGDDIFVAARSGEVFCIDAVTGQSRWGKKYPQPIDIGLGGSPGKKKRYLVGDHSNLYVVSRASGQCDEVVYLGHNPSTIAVPPIWILNHLILFENDGTDFCTMRVFNTDEEGLGLTPAQNPVIFRGHVVVEPQVDGRRLAVATNLGEVAILDVEPSNANDRVFKLVSLVGNETTPKTTWPLMAGNDLWLASTRLIYYQVQVTSQKLNRQWLNEDGDQFTNRPMKVDDHVIYTRLVRGNLGTRVSAINPTTGKPIWETDVASPVMSLGTDGKGFIASTAQGAVFSLDAKSFSGEVAVEPIENLGRNQRSLTFSNPVVLKDSKIALLNQADGNQLLLIDPARRSSNPSRLVAIELGGGVPSNEPLALGTGAVLVPLNNAQIAMLDPEKGKLIGTPFQPTVQAGERPVWLNPVMLSDKQSVVVADEKRNMVKLSTGKQLRTITSQPLDRPLKARLAIINDVIVAVSATASGDQLDFFDSGELKRTSSVPVEGRFSWGPYALQGESSNIVFALSDIEGLVACDSTGKKLWAAQLGQVVLVGRPQAIGSDCLFATTSGEIIRLSSETGKTIARVQIGEPISGTPLLLSKGMLVPCDEGVVMTVPIPDASLDSGSDTAGAN